MKAKITDGMMDAMRQIALGESMHKDDEIKEAEHEEIEEAEEEMEEAKGDGRNMNRAGTTLGGMALGQMAGTVAGGIAGAGIGAAAGGDVGRSAVGGMGLGGTAGSVAGGIKGWKHATKQNKAMYKESLDEATLAAIVEAVTPMADRIDALNEAFDSDILNEAELDAGIAQALAEAAIAGFALSQLSESMMNRSITQKVIGMTDDMDATHIETFNMTHIYSGGQGSSDEARYYIYDDRRDELDIVDIEIDHDMDENDVAMQVRAQDKNRSMNRQVIGVIMADLKDNYL